MRIRKNLANIFTLLRIIGSLLLLFLKVDYRFPSLFIFLYLLCGLTDSLDGFIARKFEITSEFGAKFDTVSDLIFYAVIMFKFDLFGSLRERHLIPFLFVGVFIRFLCYVFVAMRDKELESRHTVFNKLTGFMVFLFPLVKIISERLLDWHLTVGLIFGYVAIIDELSILVSEHKIRRNAK